jgi:hypothetical protein
MSEETKCPEEYICLTDEEWWELVEDYEVDTTDYVQQPMGDVEAGLDFIATLLLLDFETILYIGITMTIFATYGLSIYGAFKWIQSRFR